MPSIKPKLPKKLFFCYAPEDEPLRKELEKHLTLLVRDGYITSWSGHSIGIGEDFARQMAEAQVILLLVSADFLASDYLYEVELERALERRASAKEEVLVLGVLLRPSDWRHGKLQTVEMLPLKGREALAVTGWSSHDEAFENVAKNLRTRLWGVMGRISINPSVAHPSAPHG